MLRLRMPVEQADRARGGSPWRWRERMAEVARLTGGKGCAILGDRLPLPFLQGGREAGNSIRRKRHGQEEKDFGGGR